MQKLVSQKMASTSKGLETSNSLAAATKVPTTCISHKWIITNFINMLNESHPWKWKISSDHFSPPGNEQLQFEVLLYPKGVVDSKCDYIGIGVCVQKCPIDSTVEFQWAVAIVKENDEQCCIKGESL